MNGGNDDSVTPRCVIRYFANWMAPFLDSFDFIVDSLPRYNHPFLVNFMLEIGFNVPRRSEYRLSFPAEARK